MTLFEELKRRNVLRAAAAYVAVSWLLIQVVETLFPVFGLGDAAIRAVVIVLAIGFVPAVIAAWAFELTPEGLIRDSELDRGPAAVRARARRLDRIVMVALALAVGYFAFDKFLLDPARDRALAEAAREEGRTEAAEASQDAGPPVLAVLPFAAVTATEDSAFFAAGVHDDLLTRLAKLSSMLVISRTSVLEYKDTTQNIREIGAALGADAILEGGVQSAGNRIRINAQLIDAKTDEHLWAETYDRDLTTSNIFDVQDDIARAISEALHLTFSSDETENLIPTSNMAAYRAYHEALIARDVAGGSWTSGEYRQLLEQAAELDPEFTRPRALLVGSYALDAFGDQESEYVAKAEALLAELQSIAPDSADYRTAQTLYTYYIVRDYPLALQLAEQTLEMVPSDAFLVVISGWIKRRMGDSDGHVESLRRARQLEPTNQSWAGGLANALARRHEYDEAAAEIEAFEGRFYYLETLGAVLDFREHGDVDRLVRETQALADEIGDEYSAYDLWSTRLLARDYEGAAAALDELPPRRENAGLPLLGLTNNQVLSLLTYWAKGDSDRLAELVAEGRESVSLLGTTDELLDRDAILSVALLAAVEGNTAEAERLIRAWYRGGAQDLAGREMHWDKACEILGIAGAAQEAVDCLRQGLEQPSSVMPFLEPRLPFYDPIRNEPVFVELVEELANAA